MIDLSIDEKEIVNRLVASLRRRRFNYQNEKDLQSAIETVPAETDQKKALEALRERLRRWEA